MSDATRRGFLAAAGAGAATVAAVAAAPAVLAVPARPDQTRGGGEPLLAYVRDASRGEVAIMVGEREVVVQDADLVSRLTRASGR